MDNQRVTEQEAVAMLQVWSGLCRDLPSLAKLQLDNSKKLIVLMLPGYRHRRCIIPAKGFGET